MARSDPKPLLTYVQINVTRHSEELGLVNTAKFTNSGENRYKG